VSKFKVGTEIKGELLSRRIVARIKIGVIGRLTRAQNRPGGLQGGTPGIKEGWEARESGSESEVESIGERL